MKKKKILITAIGTITATNIVKAFKNCEDYWLVGADINDEEVIATSKDVDEFYKFPTAIDSPDDYLRFVIAFCERHDIEYLFSVIDEEVLNFSKNRQLFDLINVKLCIPTYEVVSLCHYKDKFVKWIETNFHELLIPTYNTDFLFTEKDFPVFVKPIEGRASNDCMLINSAEQLFRISNLDKYVIQSYVIGTFFTVDILRNKKYNQIFCLGREEILRNSNGCGIAVKIEPEGLLYHICRKLAEKIDLNGVINAEFFLTKEGYKIIEINPRFSAGASFTYMSGINVFEGAISIADGENCKMPDKIGYGKRFARRYEDYEL